MNQKSRLVLCTLSSILIVIFSSCFFETIGVSAATLSPANASEYTFTYSNGAYVEISAGTLSTATGDDGAEDITLPFLFIYDSLVYTDARISVNGWLELGQFYTGAGYANDLEDPEARPLLAPFWDDLYDDGTSEVRYQTLGSSPDRVFIVQWKEIRWAGSTGARQNFQIRLYEGSNQIEFIYGGMSNSTNTSASIGLTDPVGGEGHFISITPGNPPQASSSIADNNITTVNDLGTGTTYTFSPPCFNLWTGSLNQDWDNSENWNCSKVPGETDNATILNGTPNDPVLGSSVTLGMLGIEAGASLNLNGRDLNTIGLRIYGEIVVTDQETITLTGTSVAWDRDPTSGIFEEGNGLVVFSGSGTLTTRAPEIFFNLQVNNGKSFDPGLNAIRIRGTFTNKGTFWPSTDDLEGNVFDGPVVNESLWRQRAGGLIFYDSFTNSSDATFYASSDTDVGTIFYNNMTNYGTFNASDGGKLEAKGEWTDQGAFSPGYGKVILSGTGIQHVLAASGVNQFYDLEIANGSEILLMNNLDIQHDVAINTGAQLDLDVYTMSVGGNFLNRGWITQVKDVPAGVDTEFLHFQNSSATNDAYRGISIHPSSNLGATRVDIRGQQEAGCTNNPADPVISRCFSISPQSSSPAIIRFYFQFNELNNQDFAYLKLWDYQAGWVQAGENYMYSAGCVDGQIDCWLQAEQVTSYSSFTLGSGNNPTLVITEGFWLSPRSISFLKITILLLVGIMLFLISNPRRWVLPGKG